MAPWDDEVVWENVYAFPGSIVSFSDTSSNMFSGDGKNPPLPEFRPALSITE
ncbi:hypothetical protein DYY67_0989 [Candidatus Nitrosotalea sp. TS]|nr:hypothetical protein [Candidatus Nitrosotalea sp. TS]